MVWHGSQPHVALSEPLIIIKVVHIGLVMIYAAQWKESAACTMCDLMLRMAAI
jgi:hypothetical protein